MSTGAPLAPAAALCNMTTCLQHQVDWITRCIGYMKARGLTEIEPTNEAQDDWVKYHDEVANATLISKTDSWYVGLERPRQAATNVVVRLLAFLMIGSDATGGAIVAIAGHPQALLTAR
jgi:hypothetical protein